MINNGTTAEYYVAAELSRRGYLASMTIKNAPGVDIVAINNETDKMSCIQVKSKENLGETKKWLLGKKDEKVRDGNFFYIFVDLNIENGTNTEFYIVPATTVAERIKKNHEAKGGKEDVDMREFILTKNEVEVKEYQNWDILK